jgi:hypothetical protein
MNRDMRLLFPTLVSLSGVVLAFGVLWVLRWRSRRGRKRSPLTRDLLRAPGQSLRDQVEDITLSLVSDVMTLALVSSFAALALAMVDRPGRSAYAYPLVIILLAGAVIYFLISLSQQWRRRARLRLALDGEMATGEELNQLMLLGCHVYHDVPGDRFNIDHVVVGPAGVYAVETKTRAKGPRAGTEAAAVTYDGSVLRFPGWQDRESLQQARRQAEWLQAWLTSAVGESVTARPVLALPGWFVDRKGSGDVIVCNPKNATFLARPRSERERLTPELVQRITHQLEQRCRDVVPFSSRDLQPAPLRRNSPR